MAIRFFIQYGTTVAQLPVNPSELKIKRQGNNKTYEIVKLGEINLINQMKLQTLTIESFLPATSDGPYVLTKGKFEKPAFYIELFNKIRNAQEPCRLVISDMNFNMQVSIENFEQSLKGGDDDTYYTLELKEYKPFSAKVVTIKTSTDSTTGTTTATASTPATQRTKTGFAIGDTVVVSGKYWASSYGDGPSGTFNNFTGKISHIVADTTRKYRYHITTTSGAYRGWVAESQLTQG